MHAQDIFFQAFIYLLAAVISVPVARRLGLGSVLGYLIAGMIIGPFALGLVGREQGGVMHFAEFGVVMMLFLIGLELKPSLLWELRRSMLGLGGLQVIVTTLAVTGVAALLGFPLRLGLALGLIFAMSSTAIVLQTLQEKGLLKTMAGQNAFAVLLFQDLAVIPILAVLPLLAAPGFKVAAAAHAGRPGWLQALLVIGVVAIIVLVGRFLIRHILRFIAEARLREIFTAAALLLVIAIALAMDQVGLSPALGAFLGGVVLAESEYRHELESDIEPFKGLLLGLFFISVGAAIDFNVLAAGPARMAGLVLALIAIKLAVVFGLGRLFGLAFRENLLLSFSLAQGGEFAFVLFSFALQRGVMTEAVANPAILAVALSMALTPLLMMIYERVLQPRLDKKTEREADVIDERGQGVIIAGFGRFGQIVGRLLLANGIRPTVLELDPGQIETLRRFGFKVFYGNASRPDLLRAAGAAEARLLVLAVDDAETALQIVDAVKKEFPNLTILARARDRTHAHELMKRGVPVVFRETFSSALEMGLEALKKLGYRSHRAHRIAQLFRQHDEQSLRDMMRLADDEKEYILESRRQFELIAKLLQSESQEPALESDKAWDVSELRQDILEGRLDPPASSS